MRGIVSRPGDGIDMSEIKDMETANPHVAVIENKELIMEHFKEILMLSGFDPEAKALLRTPERQWEVLEFMTSGYEREVTLERMYDDFQGDIPNLRISTGIRFISVCEHHFMPFFGTVDIAYLPKDGLVTGMSKLPQLVLKYARRPQIQERMTQEIADELTDRCSLSGAMVIVRGHHTCEQVEGYDRDGPYITSTITGMFKMNPYLKDEARALIESTWR